MEYKVIETFGIEYLERLPECKWYFGMDYTGGDLYEAEQLYLTGHDICKTRLIFVDVEGNVFEPVKTEEGQYFGNPVFCDGYLYVLLVDFEDEEIRVIKVSENMKDISVIAEIPLFSVKDCYNLMLRISPLTLLRSGHEDDVQIIWPDKGDFMTEPTESIYFRDGDKLVFTKWFEDPDYHENTIIRKYPTGEIIEEIKGSMFVNHEGKKWILK